MNIHRRFLVALLAASTLAGCALPMGAKVGRLPELKEGAQLLVYRPADKASMYFQAHLDGKALPDNLKNSSVLLVNVSPGQHSFTIRLSPFFPSSSLSANTVSFSAVHGQRVYARVTPTSGSESIRNQGGNITVAGDYRYRIDLVPAEQAEPEMADLRYVR